MSCVMHGNQQQMIGTKYYDVLRRGLKEEVSCEPSDVLPHNAPTSRGFL